MPGDADELDLTTERPPRWKAGSGAPRTKPWGREATRSRIAGRLVLLLIGVVGLPVAVVLGLCAYAAVRSDGTKADLEPLKDLLLPLLQVVLPAVSTLVGTVVGFYFGEKPKGEE